MKPQGMTAVVMAGVLACMSVARAAETAQRVEPSKAVDMQQRAKDLKDLKWGMFVCWSFSTFSGGEWTPRVKDVSFFRAKEVDTDQWARTAKEAGMGYILFLTKHHDGFCLWDTKTTDRKVTKAPLGRDVLAELRKSCDKYGIKLALYFSEGDWTFPGAGECSPKGGSWKSGIAPDVVKAQLKELCTEYGPIEYFWTDHAIGHAGLTHREMADWIKQFQPGCLVGSNGSNPGEGLEIRTMERGSPAKGKDKGYLVAEFTYPILPMHSGGAQWFYSLPVHDNLCSLPQHIYWDYLKGVELGYIFSVDIGPDYNGRLREIDVKTLRQIGEWIRDPSKAPPPEKPSLSTGKSCKVSGVYKNEYGRGGDRALDGDYQSFWFCAETNGWLEVDLGQDKQVGRVEIYETPPNIREFALEYRVGDDWKEIIRGTTVGQCKVLDFPTVTAQHVRLHILKASFPGRINEFRVLPPQCK